MPPKNRKPGDNTYDENLYTGNGYSPFARTGSGPQERHLMRRESVTYEQMLEVEKKRAQEIVGNFQLVALIKGEILAAGSVQNFLRDKSRFNVVISSFPHLFDDCTDDIDRMHARIDAIVITMLREGLLDDNQ